jgi:hypothetical protein
MWLKRFFKWMSMSVEMSFCMTSEGAWKRYEKKEEDTSFAFHTTYLNVAGHHTPSVAKR